MRGQLGYRYDYCTFEYDMCGYQQDVGADSSDWIRYRGPTPTQGTGPSGDHTTGTSAGEEGVGIWVVDGRLRITICVIGVGR